MRFRHKKTGYIYSLLCYARDCTNSRNGTGVVVYCTQDDENTVFVREEQEFFQKFEPIDSISICDRNKFSHDSTPAKENKSNELSNRYVYHYCAHYNNKIGEIAYIDGILQLKKRITCHDEYMKLKPLIEPEHHKILTIDSLSFIGMEQYP